MDLKCDHCERRFTTNARLYMHKQNSHRTPSVLLVKHNKHHTHSTPSGFKRKHEESDDDDGGPRRNKRKRIADDEHDSGLQIIDEVNDDSENDSGLVVVDEVDGDSEDDEGLEVVDEVDDASEDDEGLEVVDEIDDDDGDDPGADKGSRPKINVSPHKPNYKVLYQNCIKKYRRLMLTCEKKLNDLNNKRKRELRQKLAELHMKHNQNMAALKRTYERRMDDLEQLKDITCDDKITAIENKHQSEIDKLNAERATKIADLEADCEAKLKVLNIHIKELEDDDHEEFSSLSKAIFNCTTMEEIFEIQRLIKNHQIDVVVQKHLKTLQNLFLSLSYGIVPICDAQRKRITYSQRDLVERIQNSSTTTAKREIRAGRGEIINLFTIINDSLKLVRNTFNRYAGPGGTLSI